MTTSKGRNEAACPAGRANAKALAVLAAPSSHTCWLGA